MKKLKIIVVTLFLLFVVYPNVNAQEIKGTSVEYRTQIENVGWQDWVSDGALSGTEGKGLRLEGIKLKTDIEGVGIKYVTHIQNIGWEDEVYDKWKTDGELSGTEGKGLRLEAIKIQLTGENAENYDVYYRVHVQNVGWAGWVSNGDESGTTGLGYRLEGIVIKIIPKEDTLIYGGYLDKIGVSTYYVSDSMKWDLSRISESCGSENGTKTIRGIHIYWDYQCTKPKGVDLTYYVYYKDSNGETKGYYCNAGEQRFNNNSEIYKEGYAVTNLAFKLSGENSNDYDIFYKALYIGEDDWRDWIKEGEMYKNSGEMQAYKIALVPAGVLPIGDSSDEGSGIIADTNSAYKGGYVSVSIEHFGSMDIPLVDGECYLPKALFSDIKRTGYTFEGFYYDQEYTDKYYASTPITSDINLYPRYVAN